MNDAQPSRALHARGSNVQYAETRHPVATGWTLTVRVYPKNTHLACLDDAGATHILGKVPNGQFVLADALQAARTFVRTGVTPEVISLPSRSDVLSLPLGAVFDPQGEHDGVTYGTLETSAWAAQAELSTEGTSQVLRALAGGHAFTVYQGPTGQRLEPDDAKIAQLGRWAPSNDVMTAVSEDGTLVGVFRDVQAFAVFIRRRSALRGDGARVEAHTDGRVSVRTGGKLQRYTLTTQRVHE
ncbi:hypothetical protein [Deinococcus soli (ex Cha et al. 2016)]|uniref:Uncharacterized protein n=2 Tax=Deinococcus soli (ex Cha et al. 2016) TaxID=1309411 RepID=A0ACC6KH01_9DEIO|nr:hypothetical protein [Deinococcus soli (ex Cha et al. 2016)]MDR6219004.1 hypothetical protein [Deinococcus soli (ex Cha et al. 2016)]MDR6328801.1 hypothetical protein [Deinococcus soli (ex Cha et al. 2016)]MDR6751712.1 hypothetical protein [Deinococcus soli (ex Cha et al. 2016)]